MKVSTLMALLASFDPELPVVVEGYEGGVTEEFTVKAVSLNRDIPHDEWTGEHQVEVFPQKPHDVAVLFEIGLDG